MAVSQAIIDSWISVILQCIADNDQNDFGDVQISDGTITDINGDTVPDGVPYVEDPDGDVLCGDKASLTIATAADTDDNGTDYDVGAKILTVPGFGDICLGDKDFDRIKTEGETIPAGTEITYPDGTTEVLAADYVVPAGEQYTFDGDEALCIPLKPLPPIEIPDTAFADPEDKTAAEVNAWIAANHPGAPIGQTFWCGGTQDTPDYAWESDGDDTAHCVKTPCCKEPQIEIDPTIDPTDPVAVRQWIIENGYGENADQVFYFIGDGSVQDPDYVWIGEGDDTVVNIESPGLNAVDNDDYTAKVGDCDLSTLRLDDTDDCYHYLVDTKTGNVVSGWCVDPEIQTQSLEYNFSNDLYADLNAAGLSNASGTFTDVQLSALTDAWTSVGPYQLSITNPSSCARMCCQLNSRLGNYSFVGNEGALAVSMLGTFGLNSPSLFFNLNKPGEGGDPQFDCIETIATPSSSFNYCIPPGATRTHSLTFRIRWYDADWPYVPSNGTDSAGGGVLKALQLDGHRFGVLCTTEKPHGPLLP